MAPSVFTSYVSNTNIGYFNLGWPSTGATAPISPPSGVGAFDRRACQIEMKKRRVYAGAYTKILTYTEWNELVTAGITAPATAPVLATTPGGALTGSQIGYVSFRHKVGSTIVQESNLSSGSSTIAFTGTQQRAWSSIPTAADARVTHVVLWVSIDGALPREIEELALGTTSRTENTAAGALGDTPPINSAGELTNSRGVPPYTRFCLIYNSRAWYFGDPEFPWRLWYSELDEIESVGALNYLDLKGRETIIAGAELGDSLGMFGQARIYLLQGFDAEDFTLTKVDATVGCINHFAIVNINGITCWPAELGWYAWYGAPRYMMKGLMRSEWRRLYKANPAAFEGNTTGGGQVVDDRANSVFKFLTQYAAAPRSRYWICTYYDVDPTTSGGGTWEWTFDYRNRLDTAVGVLAADGTARGELYTGSCDGYVRQENVLTDADDDGDTYAKTMILETGALAPAHQKGTYVEGYEYTWVDVMLMAENNDWTLEGKAGDDSAYLIGTAPFSRAMKASAKTVAGRPLIPRTSHRERVSNLAGKTVSYTFTISSPLDVEYRGLAIEYEPGNQTRGRT